MQRRLAAIVCADVAGYSRMMGADEAGTHAAFKAHRSAIVLSERVAELIDEGRKLRLKEGKRPIVVVASSEAKPDTRPAPAVEETKIVVEESRSAFGAFRVGYAAKPGLQARG